MSMDRLLSRLEGVRRTGDGKWIARCPAHADKSPSLSVRDVGDGRTLVHCFGGCAVADVVGALGMQLAELFPPRAPADGHRARREPRPYSARDVVRALKHELSVVFVVCADLASGKPIADADRIRAGQARERIVAFLAEIEHA